MVSPRAEDCGNKGRKKHRAEAFDRLQIGDCDTEFEWSRPGAYSRPGRDWLEEDGWVTGRMDGWLSRMIRVIRLGKVGSAC